MEQFNSVNNKYELWNLFGEKGYFNNIKAEDIEEIQKLFEESIVEITNAGQLKNAPLNILNAETEKKFKKKMSIKNEEKKNNQYQNYALDTFNKDLEQKSKELIELRKQAIEIDHFFNKGHYWYRPEEKEEWALVLKIKKLEREIRNIPEYRYKSVYFSNEDPWWFYPNSKDDKAIQYSKDILEIYNLLEKTKKMN